jgi:hypothetical protein
LKILRDVSPVFENYLSRGPEGKISEIRIYKKIKKKEKRRKYREIGG